MSAYRLRPFHPSDVIAEGVMHTPPPAFGMTATKDGEVVAFGGVSAVGGRWVVYFWLGDEALRKPMLLHRYATRWLRTAWALGVDGMLVFPGPHRKASAWLDALGFRPVLAVERDEAIKALERAHSGTGAWIYDWNGAARNRATCGDSGSDGSLGSGSHQGRQHISGADGLRSAGAPPAG